MPSAGFSGNIIRLDGNAAYKEGIVDGEVGGDARLAFTAEAEFCHGLNIELEAQALAKIFAGLTVFLPRLDLNASALAQAGVKADLKLSPDIFDKFGLSANVKASAQAAVAGSMAVGLDFEQISALAKNDLSPLAYDIFIIFLNEIDIEMGVWGKAACSAMAGAWLEVNGSLKESQDSGFVIKAGFDAGLGAGFGWDMYAAARLRDPRRLYNSITQRITKELIDEAQKYLPSNLKPLLPVAEFTIPLALDLAYDIAQVAMSSNIASKEKKAERINAIILAKMQSLILDLASRVALEILEEHIYVFAERVSKGRLSKQKLRLIKTNLESLATSLKTGGVSIEQLPTLAAQFSAIAESIDPSLLVPVRRPLAQLWVVLCLAKELKEGITASAGIGVLFVDDIRTAPNSIEFPSHTGVSVLDDEFKSYTDASSSDCLKIDDAIDYLLNRSGLAAELELRIPELVLLKYSLKTHLDMEFDDILSTAFIAASTGDITQTVMYGRFRGMLDELINDYVINITLLECRKNIPKSKDAYSYLDDAVEPSMRLIGSYALEQLDLFLRPGVRNETFLKGFSQTLSIVASKVMVRNVIVLSDILLSQTITSLSHEFGKMERALRRGRMDGYIDYVVDLIRQIPVYQTHSRQELKAPVKILLMSIFQSAKEANGNKVWTTKRRAKLRTTLFELLESVDGHVDYTGDPKQIIAGVLECAYVPNIASMQSLTGLMMDVLADELTIVQKNMLPAMEQFIVALSYPLVREVNTTAIAMMRTFEREIQKLSRLYDRAKKQLDNVNSQLIQAKESAADYLDQSSRYFRSASVRRVALNSIQERGLNEAKKAVRATPGYGLLPSTVRIQHMRASVKVYNDSWRAFRPYADQALKKISSVSRVLASLLRSSSSYSKLRNRLDARLKRDIQRELTRIIKVPLPKELGLSEIATIATSTVMAAPQLKEFFREALKAQASAKRLTLSKKSLAIDVRKKNSDSSLKAREYRDICGTRLSILFNDPKSITSKTAYKINRSVPLNITVRGANESFVHRTGMERVLIIINGQVLKVRPNEWKYDRQSRAIRLSCNITRRRYSWQQGVNIVECVVANGKNGITKKMIHIRIY